MALNLSLKKKDAEQEAPAPLLADGAAPTPQGDDKAGVTGSHYEWPSPAKPSAMLVPTYIRENRALAATKKQVFYGLVAVVAATVLGIVGSFLLNATSQSTLDDAVAARDGVQKQVRDLSPVANYYDGLEKRQAATVALLAGDVQHAALYRQILSALPAGTMLTGYQTALGAPCLSPDPFEPAEAIGCITVTGATDSRAKVAQALTDLQRGPAGDLVAGGFVNSIESEDKTVKFTINVNFTPEALSMKYLDEETRKAAEAAAAQNSTQGGAQ